MKMQRLAVCMGKKQELVSEKSQDPQVVDKGNRVTREALALKEGIITQHV